MQQARPPALDEVYQRLERAREQLDAFGREATAFIQSSPQGLEPRLRDQGHGMFLVFIILRVHRSPPPVLGLLAGEIVHHIHAALDHVAFALSEKRGASQGDLRSVYFPIFDDAGKFGARTKKRHPARTSGLYQMRFVQPAAQAIIKSLQPYNAGIGASLTPLWLLHELSNIEKHRRLNILGNPIGRISLLDTFGPFDLIDITEFPPKEKLQDNTIVAKGRIRAREGFQRKIRVKQNLPPHVRIEEIVPTPPKYARDVLEDIISFVETEVVAPLAPYF
jgi:hypothetical protein